MSHGGFLFPCGFCLLGFQWCCLMLVRLELGWLSWWVAWNWLVNFEGSRGGAVGRSGEVYISYVQLVDLHDVYTHQFWRQHEGLVVEIVVFYMLAKSRVVLLRYIILGGLQSVAEIHNNLLLLIVPHFSYIFWGAKNPILIISRVFSGTPLYGMFPILFPYL